MESTQTLEGPAKKRRKKSFWNHNAEAYFVELWGQKMDDLRGSRKNTHVYQEMAAELTKEGYELSAADVKYKISNLTAKYKACKDAMGPSGGSPPEWHLYEAVHKIIGGHRINNLEHVVQESIPRSSQGIMLPLVVSNRSPAASYSQSSSESSPPSPPSAPSPLPPELPSSSNVRAAKKVNVDKLVSMYEEFGKYYKEAAAENKAMSEELAVVEKEKLGVLKDMRDDNKKLTQGVLDFLSRLNV